MNILTITSSAIAEFKYFMAKHGVDSSFRVQIKIVSENPLDFSFKMKQEIQAGEMLSKHNGIDYILDRYSAMRLIEKTLDFDIELQKFVITKNREMDYHIIGEA